MLEVWQFREHVEPRGLSGRVKTPVALFFPAGQIFHQKLEAVVVADKPLCIDLKCILFFPSWLLLIQF